MNVNDLSEVINSLNQLIFLAETQCISIGFIFGLEFVQFLIHVKNQRTII